MSGRTLVAGGSGEIGSAITAEPAAAVRSVLTFPGPGCPAEVVLPPAVDG